MTKYCTGVGSRDIPQSVCTLLHAIVAYCYELGYIWRTGDAVGADKTVHDGLSIVLDRLPNTNEIEVYVPWRPKPDHHFNNPLVMIEPQLFEYHHLAQAMAEKVHPFWEKVSRGGRALHSRNPYQVLGYDLETPSEFIVYYAKPYASGAVAGGTNTAVQIARLHQIPEFNLYDPAVREQWEGMMKSDEWDVASYAKLVPAYLPPTRKKS